MLRLLFSIIILIHGLIHFIGVAKAFNYGNISQITKEISKPIGILWLLTAFLFILATTLFLLKKDAWLFFGIAAAVLSQILIFTVWKDAKFGTIANVIVLVAAILSWGTYHFEKGYQKDVKENLQRTNALQTDLLTETDLLSLPEPVHRYLEYAGVLNKPKLKNMRIVFEGQMREKGKDFFPFTVNNIIFLTNPPGCFL